MVLLGAKYRGKWAGETRQTAASLRGSRKGRLNIDGVAEQLGIRVTLERLGGSLLGMARSDRDVVLKAGLRPKERRYVLAHEIGHLLISRGVVQLTGRRAQECFADAFARELLLPAQALDSRDVNRIPTVARRYGVSRTTVVLQLARVGLLPELMRDSAGKVLCVTCGDRASVPACDCLRYRQRPQLAAPAVL